MRQIFTVDTGKCVKCGACAETCPVKVIEFKKGVVPEAVPWAKKACINCGHCVAVCPKGAMSLVEMPASGCEPIREELKISGTSAEQLFKSRRSVRIYKEEPVDKKTIEKIIDISRYAPTGHNIQPVKWKVIYDRKKVVELKELVVGWMRHVIESDPAMAKKYYLANMISACEKGEDVILRGAPHLVAAYAAEDEKTADNACRITLTYFELAASVLGLGACWAGYLDIALSLWKPLRDALELPKGYKSYCSMMFGYPEYRYYRIPSRKNPEITWL
jgi:nitroreductase/NAD-dependent dihydropyrimidine dehydrogenase PreA subunit